MKIIMLGGFLGAGKTTVLLQMASYLRQQGVGNGTSGVVILENEISESGVDNQLLTGKNFTVKNIFAGCICCTSTEGLIQAVKGIEEEFHPLWLLIEATGMAYPDHIKEVLESRLGYSVKILTLVDVKRWERVKRAMPDFVTSQLKNAQVIFLNKTDLVNADELEYVRNEISVCSPGTKQHSLCALKEQNREFWYQIVSELLE